MKLVLISSYRSIIKLSVSAPKAFVSRSSASRLRCGRHRNASPSAKSAKHSCSRRCRSFSCLDQPREIAFAKPKKSTPADRRAAVENVELDCEAPWPWRHGQRHKGGEGASVIETPPPRYQRPRR